MNSNKFSKVTLASAAAFAVTGSAFTVNADGVKNLAPANQATETVAVENTQLNQANENVAVAEKEVTETKAEYDKALETEKASTENVEKANEAVIIATEATERSQKETRALLAEKQAQTANLEKVVQETQVVENDAKQELATIEAEVKPATQKVETAEQNVVAAQKDVAEKTENVNDAQAKVTQTAKQVTVANENVSKAEKEVKDASKTSAKVDEKQISVAEGKVKDIQSKLDNAKSEKDSAEKNVNSIQSEIVAQGQNQTSENVKDDTFKMDVNSSTLKKVFEAVQKPDSNPVVDEISNFLFDKLDDYIEDLEDKGEDKIIIDINNMTDQEFLRLSKFAENSLNSIREEFENVLDGQKTLPRVKVSPQSIKASLEYDKFLKENYPQGNKGHVLDAARSQINNALIKSLSSETLGQGFTNSSTTNLAELKTDIVSTILGMIVRDSQHANGHAQIMLGIFENGQVQDMVFTLQRFNSGLHQHLFAFTPSHNNVETKASFKQSKAAHNIGELKAKLSVAQAKLAELKAANASQMGAQKAIDAANAKLAKAKAAQVEAQKAHASTQETLKQAKVAQATANNALLKARQTLVAVTNENKAKLDKLEAAKGKYDVAHKALVQAQDALSKHKAEIAGNGDATLALENAKSQLQVAQKALNVAKQNVMTTKKAYDAAKAKLNVAKAELAKQQAAEDAKKAVDEIVKPDTKLPEVSTPEIKIPETKTPKVNTPQIKTPETKKRQLKMSVTKASDIVKLDAKTPVHSRMERNHQLPKTGVKESALLQLLGLVSLMGVGASVAASSKTKKKNN
ncbi:SEC10/PgrA surface exclusion domain-containing protein [Streptococcus phocae]|uniref:Gram-positive cocci surface proteins LPxTG domain-containing protein n=1 Tax=Streptococcus phocae TaxID=119224 RepID=A0A0P6S309_9STRE|nr:SEC10/PgrA surface exclusion domain-containing protein [Streptococcus phocae]KPJ21775.1 hypothetical protein AKK44_08005 [Streptococcus phocae]